MRSRFDKLVVRLLGLFLIAISIFSCTYDYFEDESNFRIQVPQMTGKDLDGNLDQIERLYISLHEKNSGKHVLTRQLEAPFDQDELMRTQGIMRFKLAEADYIVTCFAEYAPGSISEGQPLGESYKYQFKCKEDSWWLLKYQGAKGDAYDIGTTYPRMMQVEAHAYSLGHAQSGDPVVVDITPKQCYKGKVFIDFLNMPDTIMKILKRIDVFHNGPGTRLHFDGSFDRVTAQDCLYISYDKTYWHISEGGTNISLPVNLMDASSGTVFSENIYTAAAPGTLMPVELDIIFYDDEDRKIGDISFTQADFDALSVDRRPKDEDGNPATSLILYPHKGLRFTFNQFTLIGLLLTDWNGNPVYGETTPM